MENFKIVDHDNLLEGLDPKSHDIWGKPMADSISFDVGEGKDRGVLGVYDVDRGEYTFSAEVVDMNTDVLKMMFGINGRPKTFRERCDEAYNRGDDRALFYGIMERQMILGLSGKDTDETLLDKDIRYCTRLFVRLLEKKMKMKRRRTTYRTIRRDCAKRNRRK